MQNNRKVKMLAIITITFTTQLLVGCSGGIENEFLEKIKTKVSKQGESCYKTKNLLDMELLKNGNNQYIAVMSGTVMNFYKDQQARGVKMAKALQRAGYVSGSKRLKYNFRNYTGYALNEKGRKYIIWDKGVCVGKRNVTGIVEYTEPADRQGKTYTEVTYKYDLILNDIVSDLGLEAKVKGKLPGEGKASFVKTNKGWRLINRTL